MDPKKFLTTYLEDFSDLVMPKEETLEKLAVVADLLKDVHSAGKKTLILVTAAAPLWSVTSAWTSPKMPANAVLTLTKLIS